MRAVIWDFNGTILDDVQIGLETANILLGRYGKPPIASVEEYRKVFGFPVIDYYARIGLERENFSTYAVEWFEAYRALEPRATLYDGVTDLLAYFHKRGCAQYLLSATESAMLEKQIRRLGIESCFDAVIGQDNIHAHGKIGAAKEFAARVGLQDALMIGDSVHDAQVAEAIGAKCALLAWGHQDAERLVSTGHPVFECAQDIQKAIENGEL